MIKLICPFPFSPRFRHQVAQLYDAAQVTRDWAGTVSSTLSIRVRRDRLMQDALHTLQQVQRGGRGHV